MAYSPLPHPFTSSAMLEHTPSPLMSSTSAKESFLDDFNRPEPDEVIPPPHQGIFRAATLFVWKTLVLPAMGLAYLVFCYVCHYRLVRIGGAADPLAHLSLIKAGVTSISILFVSISLLPLYSLISDLKSEEFFRVLSVKSSGVPLNSVNGISTPSYGLHDSLRTLYRRHASVYFTGALFAGLVGLAVSTLAPAALSVGTVLFDGDVVALSVGAVRRNTIANMSDFTKPQLVGPSPSTMDKGSQAGSVAWAEFSLGVNYSFQSPTMDQATYIIPTPPKLPPATHARWLSDVIAMHPKCEWIAPDLPFSSGNFSDFSANNTLLVNLTSKHVTVTLSINEFDFSGSSLKPMTNRWGGGLSVEFPGVLTDMNTMDDLSNGATAFLFRQCVAGCTSFDSPINVTFGSDVHTSRFNSFDGKAVDLSFLYCEPHAEIETRHITNDGKGVLSVGNKTLISQGNLHPIQTSLLLSYALLSLAESGPEMPSNVSSLGHEVQFSMVFGTPSLDSTELPVQPIASITASYAAVLKSAVKPFLDGSLASANVPARGTQEIVVFSASSPHFIASTVLYVLLTLFVLACHFRRHAAQFTFFAVASRLARSDIPPLFAELKSSESSRPTSEDVTVTSLRKARLMLDGGETLRLRNDI